MPSSPTTMLGCLAARTDLLLLSTTLITTNDPVKIAEDGAMLQHLADGRVDLMMGRGNTGPVYPWFGKDIRDDTNLAIENYALLLRHPASDIRRFWVRSRSVDRPLDRFQPVATIAERGRGAPFRQRGVRGRRGGPG